MANLRSPIHASHRQVKEWVEYCENSQNGHDASAWYLMVHAPYPDILTRAIPYIPSVEEINIEIDLPDGFYSLQCGPQSRGVTRYLEVKENVALYYDSADDIGEWRRGKAQARKRYRESLKKQNGRLTASIGERINPA